MSATPSPSKDPDPIKAESRIDGSTLPVRDADATLDALDPGASPAAGGATSTKSIGPYRLVKKLGEGGMGQVWLAKQTAPLQRQVALKLIRAGMYDDTLLQRFLAERQSLAIMDHPSIAKVFDAGATPDGQPYFVMEYVPGDPITRYCDEKRLSIRERLELFIRVCEGVEHAHQKAIIHRDLKPANILVVEVDGKPTPRIIDFGLARAASPQEAGETLFTQAGAFIGTRGFMSPEQADPGSQDVDTRTDVYSLGVVLYVLLTGMLPFDTDQWKKKPFEEVLRQLREEDPRSPSSKVSTEKEAATAAAARRGTEPRPLVSLLRGDLDWITLKALEKDKEHRYASAASLAADIQRYLKDEPITARPPSAGYQLQKFARRHRALVAGVTAVFVVLLAGIAVSTWQAIRARRAGQVALAERDRATAAEQAATKDRDRALSAEQIATSERNKAVAAQTQTEQERNRALREKQRADDESATAKAVNGFLQNDLLAQASASAQARPDTKPDPDLKVRTALDRAAASIQGKFERQPLVEASIRQTIGDTYKDLGIYPEAQKQMERAFDLRRRVQGEEQPDTVVSMAALADLYDRQNKESQAETLFQKALGIQRRVLGDEDPATLSTMHSLASMYERRGKDIEAEPLFAKFLGVQRRTLGEENPATLSSMDGLATLYTNEGKYAQAEPLYTKVLEVRRRTLGEEHPAYLDTLNNLAELYRAQAKYSQAEPLFSKVLETQRRVLGSEHPDTLVTMNNLAGVYVGQGKYAEAESLHTAVIEVMRRVLGEEHRDTLLSMNNLGLVYYRQAKYAQAEAQFAKVLEVQSHALGEEHRDTLITMNNLGAAYRIQRKYAEAEAIFKKAVDLETRVLGPEHPNTVTTLSGLGVLYRSQGKYAEAEPIMIKVMEARRRILGQEHPETLVSMNNLAVVYRDHGNYTQAEPLFKSVLDLRRRVLGEEDPDTLSTMTDLAILCRNQGRYAETDALFSKVLEVRRRVLGPQHPNTTDVMVSLGEVHLLQRKYSEAESLLRQALSNYEKASSDSWRRHQSQSLLGACLAGQEKYAEAESLQVAGYQGLIQREVTIPFEARPSLEQAGDRLVKLYESWGKLEKASEWREKLRTKASAREKP